MPTYRAKPIGPKVHHRGGAPSAWYLMAAPRRASATDTGDVIDIMNPSNPAGVRTSATWVDGPNGKRLSFNGSSSSVLFGNVANYSFSQPFSIGFNFNTLSAGVDQVIAGAYDATDTGWHIRITTANKIRLIFVAAGINFIFIDTTSTVLTATEYRGIATWDGTTPRIYLNGVLMAGAVTTSGSTPNLSGTRPFQIGRDASGKYFGGQIDNVPLWDRCLPASEIPRETFDPYWRLRPPSPRVFLVGNLAVSRRLTLLGCGS